MVDLRDKQYVAIVQCHLVKQRCSGYSCERAFHERSGGFSIYPKDTPFRTLYLTCGGCCGRALHRKLSDLVRQLGKKEEIDKSRIAVQLSSCIALDSHHGPQCPHRDYLRTLIARLGLDVYEGTQISEQSQQRREAELYARTGERTVS